MSAMAMESAADLIVADPDYLKPDAADVVVERGINLIAQSDSFVERQRARLNSRPETLHA